MVGTRGGALDVASHHVVRTVCADGGEEGGSGSVSPMVSPCSGRERIEGGGGSGAETGAAAGITAG